MGSKIFILKYTSINKNQKQQEKLKTQVLTSVFGLLKYLMLKEKVVSYIYTR